MEINERNENVTQVVKRQWFFQWFIIGPLHFLSYIYFLFKIKDVAIKKMSIISCNFKVILHRKISKSSHKVNQIATFGSLKILN
jgi:hypothetical protein